MSKKKKIKRAVSKKPVWVGDLPLIQPEPGLVYNIYQCRECVIDMTTDMTRSQRKRSILLPGDTKKTINVVCAKHKEPLLIKFKRCICGAEYWGFYLHSHSTCKECGKYVEYENTKTKDWYRLRQYIKTTSEDLSDKDKWDCINRNLCLECTFVSGYKRAIACKDCPEYETYR